MKVVWITMMALKDRRGFVSGSVPGLARLAVVSVEECENALKIFESPDPYSKSTENEGRRIRTVNGGWVVLGHEKFQKKMKEVSTKVNGAKRQRQFRERKKVNRNIPSARERKFEDAVRNGDEAEASRITDNERAEA